MSDTDKTLLHSAVQHGKVEIMESDRVPTCPHCTAPLHRILKQLSMGALQTEAIYSCETCGKLLAIGYGSTWR